MLDVLVDSLIDSAKMLPWLFLIYLLIEYFQHKYGQGLAEKTKKAGKAGPLLSAVFGCIPQCGFSVIATSFYTRKIITLGTLIAVYLSTSDEAVPVILSQPDKIGYIVPIISIKIAIAIVAGYALDFAMRKKQDEPDKAVDECCSHVKCCSMAGEDGHSHDLSVKELLYHPIVHTIKVFLTIFAVTFALGLVVEWIGADNIGRLLLDKSILQPMIAALIGLIPNCAASVIITEMFLQGVIGLGSVIAGLSASAGLGLIMLFKENKNLLENLKIVAILYAIGAASGIIIQLFVG